MSVDETIDEYYKLKGDYYSKYNKAKKSIFKKTQSTTARREKVKKIQMKCVNCKKNVGTIFESKDRILTAKCGDRSNPCDLDIQIRVGRYDTIDNIDYNINSDLELAKLKIIEIKLLLLFNLGDDDEVLMSDFEELRETYKTLLSIKNMIGDTIKENNTVKVDSIDGKRDVQKNILVEANKVKLNNIIENFKELIANYEETDKRIEKNGIMNDAIDLYINQILPTEKTIRENLYDITSVLITETKAPYEFKIKQIREKFESKIIKLEDPEVLSNKK